jgi:flagellar basal-body rod protein FlgB
MPVGLDNYLQFNAEALKLRSYRQELIAANIANSDTPNYKAVDIDFTQALKAATERPTASGAVSTAAANPPELLYRMPAQASLDGNTVEMDAERAKFADNTVRYEAAMRFLSGQLRTLLAAVQGQ